MQRPDLGVVVVTYGASDEIAGCLESLMAARAEAGGERLRVVVVDNASPDDTVATIRGWADGSLPFAPPPNLPFDLAAVPRPIRLVEGEPGKAPDPSAAVTLIHSGTNRGFAGGVNVGLAHLAQDQKIGHFWVLNPDSMAPPASVSALLSRLAEGESYGLMGGRVIYLDRPDTIQIDGGLLNRWTGVTGNYNLGRSVDSTPPDPAMLDFITGASMVASRAFYEMAGPMREDYFLYYEEVDWAMRRGDMSLAYCDGLRVYHWGGTAIGSPVVGRRAAPFSLYFKHRGRIMFERRFAPWALPVAWSYSLAQAARLALLQRSPDAAWAVLAASFGLPVPTAIRCRIGPEAAALAFGEPASGPSAGPAVISGQRRS